MKKEKKLNGMDTPWHIGYVTMSEGDHKRHKNKCIYYNKENNKCKYMHLLCGGSSHCDWYKEEYQESDEEVLINPIGHNIHVVKKKPETKSPETLKRTVEDGDTITIKDERFEEQYRIKKSDAPAYKNAIGKMLNERYSVVVGDEKTVYRIIKILKKG